MHVANADDLAREETEFAALMRELDIVNARKASFIGRVVTPEFLADHTDIVISNQWGLALNYFYLECCWQGYPLIHNASIVEDLGFYYAGNDVSNGARLLLDVLGRTVAEWDAWREGQRRVIDRFLSGNADLIAAYDDLLCELVTGESRPPTKVGKPFDAA